jgi:hypothetical protein
MNDHAIVWSVAEKDVHRGNILLYDIATKRTHVLLAGGHNTVDESLNGDTLAFHDGPGFEHRTVGFMQVRLGATPQEIPGHKEAVFTGAGAGRVCWLEKVPDDVVATAWCTPFDGRTPPKKIMSEGGLTAIYPSSGFMLAQTIQGLTAISDLTGERVVLAQSGQEDTVAGWRIDDRNVAWATSEDINDKPLPITIHLARIDV